MGLWGLEPWSSGLGPVRVAREINHNHHQHRQGNSCYWTLTLCFLVHLASLCLFKRTSIMLKKMSPDFTELLAESQRLTHHSDDAKRLRRNVGELEKASYALADKDKSSRGGGGGGHLAAYRLLSQKAYDAQGLLREIHNIKLRTQLDPSEENLESTDIEGYLQHHQDLIVLTAIGGARRSAEENVQYLQRRWIDTNWKEARKNFTESLGRPAQDPEALALTSHNASGGGGVARIGMAELGSTHKSRHRGREMDGTLSHHIEVVAKINKVNTDRSDGNFFPFEDLRKSVNLDKGVGMEPRNLRNYKKTLKLLSDMVGRKRSGQFSPLYFGSSGSEHLPYELTKNARVYFEEDFKIHMDKNLEKQIGAQWIGQDEEVRPGRSGLVRTKKYVGESDGVNHWPVIYYSIRIGDIESALYVLKYEVQSQGNPFIEALLGLLGVAEDTMVADRHRVRTGTGSTMNLRNWLQICRSRLDDANQNPYLLQILNLLTLYNHDTEYIEYESIETSIWCKLWFINWSQNLYQLASSNDIIRDLPHSDEQSLMDSPSRFAEIAVDDLDLDLPGEECTDPFIDAQILIAAQKFGHAVYILWKNATTQVAATHILVVCLYYGLLLPHEPLAHGLMPESLLTKWNELNKDKFDIGVRAQYILALRSNWKDPLRREHDSLAIDGDMKTATKFWEDGLVKLLVSAASDNDAVTKLVGPLDKMGAREGGGVLDEILSTEEVKEIIEAAASECVDKDSLDAVLLYKLSGNYGNALVVACRQLNRVAFSRHDQDRQQTINMCRNFSSEIKKSSHIKDRIRSGDTDHENYLQILFVMLTICDGVDAEAKQDFKTLQDRLKDLDLFPPSKAEEDTYVQKYNNASQSVQEVKLQFIDKTLEMYMRRLTEEYKQIKSNPVAASGSRAGPYNVQYKLDDIRAKAEALLGFSRNIKLKNPQQTFTKLSNMKDLIK